MKKLVLATMLVVAFSAIPAFAAVQNIKVSGDIDSTYLYRENFDLGRNVIGDEVQSLFLTQATLRVDAELTENVQAVLRLINERAWGEEDDPSTNNTDVDLNLAYVTLKEMLYQPLMVVAGRQDFRYGNSLVMDSIGPNNIATGALATIAQDLTKRKALDAIRAILDYNPLTVEVFLAKVDANTLTAVSDDDDDIDLYGTNLNYKVGDEWNSELEGYFFAKIDKTPGSASASNKGDKNDSIYTPGLHASTNPIKGLNVQGEVAWQGGNKVTSTTVGGNNQKREAMAAQALASYQVPLEATKEWNPVVSGVYTYVSGDSNVSDDNTVTTAAYANEASREKWTAWDPLFENQGGGTVYNTLFDLTNLHIITASAQVNPIEDVTAKVSWTGMWLDKKVPNGRTLTLRQPDGGTSSTADVTRDDEVGYEIDAQLAYNYTEDVTIGASFGWFVPGDLFVGEEAPNIHNDTTASQALVNVDVNF